jgi:tetratricopeptide (TPR) repeat protein
MKKIRDIESAISWCSKNFKTRTGLITFLVLYLSSWYSLSKIEADFFSTLLVQNVLIVGLLLVFVLWWFKRNQEKLSLGKEIKIAIAFQTDETVNIPLIESFLHPVLEKLRRNSEFQNISFIRLRPDEIMTSKEAESYVSTNHFSIDKLLWFNIEVGFMGQEKVLSVKEVVFAYKNIPKQIFFNGVKIEIENEFRIGSLNTNINLMQTNQVADKENFKRSLKQIILYALGLSCVFEMRFKESLSALKEIYKRDDSVMSPQKDPNTDELYFTIGESNLLSARLRDLLSKIYLNVILEYQKKGETYSCYKLCIEAKEQLGEIKGAYWVFVQLARLSYEMGRLDEAKIYTDKMKRIAGRDTDEVIVNKAFFSILDEDIDGAVEWYKKMSQEGITCGAVDIVTFLNEYSPVTVCQLNLRDYAVAVLTYLYIDNVEGKSMMKVIKQKVERNKKYTSVVDHLNNCLKYKKRKQA